MAQPHHLDDNWEFVNGSWVLKDGGRVNFDLRQMRDARPGSVYLTDSSDPHAWARTVRDAARDAQNDPLPASRVLNGDAPPRPPSSTPVNTDDSNAMVRDLARASQY